MVSTGPISREVTRFSRVSLAQTPAGESHPVVQWEPWWRRQHRGAFPDAPNAEAFSLDLNPRAVQFDLLARRR